MTKQVDHQVERLMFFSDAVFAIAITLLIIEVKLPHLEVLTNGALIDAFRAITGQLVGFVISFFVIAAFWAAHHRAFQWVERADAKLVWANLRYLLFIAFLPFPTAVMSEYISVPLAVAFYALMLAAAALFQVLLWQYALKNAGIVRADAPQEEIRLHMRRSHAVLGVAIVGIAIAYFVPFAALILFMLMPLVLRICMLSMFDRKAKLSAINKAGDSE
jgi:uncharacterized membrane protein